MSVTRKCVCCSKQYEFCPNCAKKDQPAWMVTFCSETCKELFNLVAAYNSKRIGQQTVLDYVNNHGLNVNRYTDSIKKVLNRTEEVGHSVPDEQMNIEQEVDEDVPKVFEHRARSRSRRRRHR